MEVEIIYSLSFLEDSTPNMNKLFSFYICSMLAVPFFCSFIFHSSEHTDTFTYPVVASNSCLKADRVQECVTFQHYLVKAVPRELSNFSVAAARLGSAPA
jgi:hypothetical protein